MVLTLSGTLNPGKKFPAMNHWYCPPQHDCGQRPGWGDPGSEIRDPAGPGSGIRCLQPDPKRGSAGDPEIWGLWGHRVLQRHSATIAASERNWSAYGYVQTDVRNRLQAKTAEKLVYAYWNCKFLREREQHDFENDFFVWDADEPAEEE